MDLNGTVEQTDDLEVPLGNIEGGLEVVHLPLGFKCRDLLLLRHALLGAVLDILRYLLLDALNHGAYGSSHELGFKINDFHDLVNRLLLV